MPRKPERKELQALYNSPRWRRARAWQLKQEPLCALCRQTGRLTPATVCDHKTPHRGDLTLFWDPKNWQSVCGPCHSGAKQAQEKSGHLRGGDINGMPLDPDHPWNQ